MEESTKRFLSHVNSVKLINYKKVIMKNPSTFSRNMQVILSRLPALVDVITSADPSEFMVRPARKEGCTLIHQQGVTLHSRFDPIREAEDLVQARGMGGGGNWMVFGFGLGYHLQAALRSLRSVDSLTVVELCPEVVAAAFEHVDLTELLSSPNFQLWLPGGIPSLEQRIADISGEVRVLIHPSSLALWRRQELPLTDILDRIELDRMNVRYSGVAYQEAVEQNREILDACNDVESYFGMIDHCPIMVVGAGPSLDDVKPLIKKYRTSLFVIAVNAAFVPLRNAGISPDAVLCVEPRDAAAPSFDGLGEDYIPLICVPGTNPEVVENWNGPRLKAYTSSTPSPHTGTVAGCALDVALRLGGNPILLAGMDLALSDGWYAGGVLKSTAEAAGKMSARTLIDDDKMMADACTVAGVDGNPVPSTRAFKSFIHALEGMVETAKLVHPELRVFDLKSRGALIKGTEPMRPDRRVMEKILGMEYRQPELSYARAEEIPAGVNHE